MTATPSEERVAMSDIDGIPVWFYDHPDRPPPNPHKEGTRIVVLGDSVLMPMGSRIMTVRRACWKVYSRRPWTVARTKW